MKNFSIFLICFSLLALPATGYQVTDLRQLTNGPLEESGPAFSADGSKIAYRYLHSPYSWDNCDIWVMNADGTGQTQITTDSRGEFGPRFAPDGRISYTKEFGSNDYDLWIVNGNGSNPHSLIGGSYRQQNCRWHPNGTKIAYESECQWAGPTEIWSANPDGSGKVQLTDHTTDGYAQIYPLYSRAGDSIVYASTETSSSVFHLWTMNIYGSEKQQITFGDQNQYPVFWWTDDSLLGYVQDGELWLHDLSAGTDELLLSIPGWTIGNSADLSCDGTRLVFGLSDGGLRQHIWSGEVPEPASLLLLGLGALALLRERRAK